MGLASLRLPGGPRDSTALCLSADSSPQGAHHLIISSDVVDGGEAQTTGFLATPGGPTMEQIGVPLFWRCLQAPHPICVPQPRLSALKTDRLRGGCAVKEMNSESRSISIKMIYRPIASHHHMDECQGQAASSVFLFCSGHRKHWLFDSRALQECCFDHCGAGRRWRRNHKKWRLDSR